MARTEERITFRIDAFKPETLPMSKLAEYLKELSVLYRRVLFHPSRRHVAYSVRNESFVSMDQYERVDFGNLACVYSKSRFLDYVANATFASQEYPGNLCRIGINCLNHIVDVVSTVVPTVQTIRG